MRARSWILEDKPYVDEATQAAKHSHILHTSSLIREQTWPRLSDRRALCELCFPLELAQPISLLLDSLCGMFETRAIKSPLWLRPLWRLGSRWPLSSDATDTKRVRARFTEGVVPSSVVCLGVNWRMRSFGEYRAELIAQSNNLLEELTVIFDAQPRAQLQEHE